MLNPTIIKKDFPILGRLINGRPLSYLDSGATSQKPIAVLEAERLYYEQHNANVHRGAHTLGDEATQAYEEARGKVAAFIGVSRREEVIFVRNTTEAINLVACSWGLDNLRTDDVVITTLMEHHANIVPWQEVVRGVGAKLVFVGLTDEGQIDLADYKEKLKLHPKIVTLAHVSNSLGTVNPVLEMTRLAHKAGALVLIDGAQAVPHMSVNMAEIGCDFYAFSGHKMLGPLGVGVLWGRKEHLNMMSPFLTGGGMINEVYTDHATWAELPEKFEAGTPNVAGAVGLAAAIDYLSHLGMEQVWQHDQEIVAYALAQLAEQRELSILGPSKLAERSGSVSFTYHGVHAHDVATILDSEGVAIRSGHHCTMPLHNHLGVAASVRASFNVYTTKDDIDRLVSALAKVKTIFKK